MALLDFLKANEKVVQARIEEKSSALAGVRRADEVPKSGLPVFFKQLLHVLEHAPTEVMHPEVDSARMVRAANDGDEPAMAAAAGRPFDVEVAKSAGAHGGSSSNWVTRFPTWFMSTARSARQSRKLPSKSRRKSQPRNFAR